MNVNDGSEVCPTCHSGVPHGTIKLHARIAELEKALEWYATVPRDDEGATMPLDTGERALVALGRAPSVCTGIALRDIKPGEFVTDADVRLTPEDWKDIANGRDEETACGTGAGSAGLPSDTRGGSTTAGSACSTSGPNGSASDAASGSEHPTETALPREAALEEALRKIAEGEAGDEQAHEWAEYYDSIRRFARNAIEAPPTGSDPR